MSVLLGVFVGGASRRMGGAPKGLLPAKDTGEPLVARALRVGREAGLECVLVGDAAAYAAVAAGAAVVRDAARGVGPLGGLCGLLERAGARRAIALACDMPYVTAELLARLAAHPSSAVALAPRRAPGAPYEPLLARYDAPRALPVARAAMASGAHGLQPLLVAMGVEAFPLEERDARALDDWDTPGDVER